MKHPSTPVHPDGRPVAELEEIRVLDCVQELGEARHGNIARTVWPEASPPEAAEMARRSVARLVGAKHLTQRKNASGSDSLLLSRRGTARLAWHNIGAWEGYDLRSETMVKAIEREIATSYLIGRSALDHSVFGLHALSTGLAPVGRDDLMGRFGAAPDGLALVPGRERGHDADWVEVVVRDWPQTEFERIFAIARSVS